MVDEQTPVFAGGERLVAMTLGLAAVADRVVSLLALRRAGGPAAREPREAESEPQPLALAILGMLSLRRTLWASLSLQRSVAESASAQVVPADPASAPAAGAFRGLLR